MIIDELLFKQELVDFIKSHGKYWAKKDLNDHSIAGLILIKESIKIDIAKTMEGKK